ncbi:Eos1 [Kluyveromyces lactis]|nr:Eos1 [Kluyveromyces lactis]
MDSRTNGARNRSESKKSSTSVILRKDKSHHSLRNLTLTHLTAKQHFLIALCRDVSLLPPIFAMCQSLAKAWSLSFETNVLYSGSSGLTNKMKMAWSAYIGTTTSTEDDTIILSALTTARSSEYFLASMWCLVSMYLSYSILDSLMVRWIIKYATMAAIFRMFSMSLVMICFELLLTAAMSPSGKYHLHTWILISCLLTGGYIWQSFITSNLIYGDNASASQSTFPNNSDSSSSRRNDSSSSGDNDDTGNGTSNQELTFSAARSRKKKLSSSSSSSSASQFQLRWSKRRRLDLYKVTVFCVVPVGFTSFLTMIVLLRNLFIQRLDVEHMERLLRNSYHN